MTMEFGTVHHRSSVLTKSLNSTLEAFSFADCRSINLVSCCKDISLNLSTKCVLISVLKLELSDISLAANASLLEVTLHSLCYAMSVNDLLLSGCILVNYLVLFVNEAHLNCAVAIVLYCLNLCYHTRTSLKNCYRNEGSVFCKDLSHSDLCC